MQWLNKLSGRCEKPGLEQKILKKLPRMLLASAAIPFIMTQLARLFASNPDSPETLKYFTSVDIFAIALFITALAGLLTLAIACAIVSVMKGPAYVADAYELEDHESPDTPRKKTHSDQ